MIYFFGDTHGHFDHVLEIVSRDRPAAIVLLGDLQAQRPLDVELESILGMTEVWFIHGNHDTDSDADYDNLFGFALADRNLHGRVAVVGGVRIAGLGGCSEGRCGRRRWTGCSRVPRSSPRAAAGAIAGATACRASTAVPSSRRTTFAWSRSAPIFW